MKIRRKGSQCLNCGLKLNEEFNYCPQCGQENNNNQLSFGTLIREFFSNYFSLDSRFGRTFKPFLTMPGQLTQAFMEGRRVSYANPIRWYLVVSLVHFFVLSFVPTSSSQDERPVIRTSETGSGSGISFSTDSDTIRLSENKPDTIKSASDDSVTTSGSFLISGKDLQVITEMVKEDYSKEEILDSLKVESMPFGKKLVTRQLVKLQMSNTKTLNAYILKNIPIMMFVLLPIYALLLKLFFRKRLYINHLIHSIHLHSFTFFVLIFCWIIVIFSGGDFPSVLRGLIFLLLTYYTLRSFKTAYQIKWFRSVWSVFLSGFLYSLIMMIGMILLVFISALLF